MYQGLWHKKITCDEVFYAAEEMIARQKGDSGIPMADCKPHTVGAGHRSTELDFFTKSLTPLLRRKLVKIADHVSNEDFPIIESADNYRFHLVACPWSAK